MALFSINSSVGVSLGDFLKNPKQVLSASLLETIAVFDAGEPLFYVTPAHTAEVSKPQTPALLPGDGFEAVARRLIDEELERVRRGEVSKDSLLILKNRLYLHILPYFNHIAPSRVQGDDLYGFLNHLGSHQLSSVTISQYFVVVRKLLKHAKRAGLIDEWPEIPVIKIKQKPRSSLSLIEYQTMVKTALRLSRQRVSALDTPEGSALAKRWVYPRDLTLPADMASLVRFMVNSFVRPGDIRQLKHRHVQVVRGGKTYLRLKLPESKSHNEPIVTLAPAVRVYENLLQRAAQTGHDQPDDYVFMPHEKNRDYALAVMSFWFRWVLAEADLPTHDVFERSRTLYCLRHTSIMFRLLYGQGIDVLTLAKNARTSVQMIEKFYASSLSAEMNIDLLQSRRTRTP